MDRLIETEDASRQAQIHPSKSGAVVRRLSVVGGECLHSTVPGRGRKRSQSPSRTSVAQHLPVELSVVRDQNLAVQEGSERWPDLVDGRRRSDGPVRDPMHSFGVRRYRDCRPDELLKHDESVSIDDADVDHVIKAEADSGRLGVQKQYVGPVDEQSRPFECFLLARERSQGQPPSGAAADSTARNAGRESSRAIARATTSSACGAKALKRSEMASLGPLIAVSTARTPCRSKWR